MRKWRLHRSKVKKWLEKDAVREEHTADEHRYRDTRTDVLYTESVTKIITITNTEGYAQKNARSIIAQITAEFPQYTVENLNERLLAAMHVSTDKFDAQGLGTEIHRLLDLWCGHLIEAIERQGVPFPVLSTTIIAFAQAHSVSDLPAWAGEPQLDGRVMAALNAFEKWRSEKQVVPIATEIALVSKQLCTGGKIDLLCLVGGVLTLVDYKSGKLDGKHWLQQGAYYIMLRECLRMTVTRITLWQPVLIRPDYVEEHVEPVGTVIDILRCVIRAHKQLDTLKTLRAPKRRTL